MLERLGVGGMSSDESDGEDINPPTRLDAPRFHILRPTWRAKGLVVWLHMIDGVHMIARKSGDNGSSLRGAYPRLRIYNAQSPRFSTSNRFVSKLPLDAYDVQWLNARNDLDFSVQPTQETYGFNHDDEIYE